MCCGARLAEQKEIPPRLQPSGLERHRSTPTCRQGDPKQCKLAICGMKCGSSAASTMMSVHCELSWRSFHTQDAQLLR